MESLLLLELLVVELILLQKPVVEELIIPLLSLEYVTSTPSVSNIFPKTIRNENDLTAKVPKSKRKSRSATQLLFIARDSISVIKNEDKNHIQIKHRK